MEFLEVLRRWIWIFFRVETEWVRQKAMPVVTELPLVNLENGSDKMDYD